LNRGFGTELGNARLQQVGPFSWQAAILPRSVSRIPLFHARDEFGQTGNVASEM